MFITAIHELDWSTADCWYAWFVCSFYQPPEIWNTSVVEWERSSKKLVWLVFRFEHMWNWSQRPPELNLGFICIFYWIVIYFSTTISSSAVKATTEVTIPNQASVGNQMVEHEQIVDRCVAVVDWFLHFVMTAQVNVAENYFYLEIHNFTNKLNRIFLNWNA